MINLQVCNCAIALLSLILSKQCYCALEVGAEEDRWLEIQKNLTTEKIKSQILQQFGKKEPPVFPNTTSRLSKEVIDMLIKRDEREEPSEQQNNVANLMILPIVRDFQCQWYNVSTCRRFEYNLSSNVISSTGQLWIHKSGSFPLENLTTAVLCSNSGEAVREIIGQEFFVENVEDKWLVYRFPVLQNFTNWKENIKCEIEITGLISDENDVLDPNRPFLKIKELETKIKKREVEENTEQSLNCNIVSMRISFYNIGLHPWIVYPESFDAKFCYGSCTGVQSYHEYLLDLFFNKNETLEEKYGRCWATCCRPKEYENMNLIHLEDDNTYAHRLMTNMIVKSCSCS